MTIELKVKIKSLAAEAKFIRKEELKQRGYARAISDKQGLEIEVSRSRDLYSRLHHHRTAEVRPEARASNIAYGLLRGRTYDQIESSAHTSPDWRRVKKLVQVFGNIGEQEAIAMVDEWKEPAGQ